MHINYQLELPVIILHAQSHLYDVFDDSRAQASHQEIHILYLTSSTILILPAQIDLQMLRKAWLRAPHFHIMGLESFCSEI